MGCDRADAVRTTVVTVSSARCSLWIRVTAAARSDRPLWNQVSGVLARGVEEQRPAPGPEPALWLHACTASLDSCPHHSDPMNGLLTARPMSGTGSPSA